MQSIVVLSVFNQTTKNCAFDYRNKNIRPIFNLAKRTNTTNNRKHGFFFHKQTKSNMHVCVCLYVQLQCLSTGACTYWCKVNKGAKQMLIATLKRLHVCMYKKYIVYTYNTHIHTCMYLCRCMHALHVLYAVKKLRHSFKIRTQTKHAQTCSYSYSYNDSASIAASGEPNNFWFCCRHSRNMPCSKRIQ